MSRYQAKLNRHFVYLDKLFSVFVNDCQFTIGDLIYQSRNNCFLYGVFNKKQKIRFGYKDNAKVIKFFIDSFSKIKKTSPITFYCFYDAQIGYIKFCAVSSQLLSSFDDLPFQCKIQPASIIDIAKDIQEPISSLYKNGKLLVFCCKLQ